MALTIEFRHLTVLHAVNFPDSFCDNFVCECHFFHFLSWLCCSEYLATFKKTVAMHEVFLQRVALHNKLREDVNFKVFLEYEEDVSCYLRTQILWAVCNSQSLLTLQDENIHWTKLNLGHSTYFPGDWRLAKFQEFLRLKIWRSSC